jgi:hypothetical protein
MAELPPVSGDDVGAVDTRRIACVGLALAVLLAAIVGGVLALHAWDARSAHGALGPSARPAGTGEFPEPTLQTQPAEDRQRYFAQQRAKAHEYAWIDRSRGVVRIPVERAMRLLQSERTAAGTGEAEP